MSTHPDSLIHRIRLVGPWEWQLLSSDAHACWQKIRLPDDWCQLSEGMPAVSFRRRFHSPSGISPDDQIFVRITTLGELRSVRVNGNALISQVIREELMTGFRFDMTPFLSLHNLLEIDVATPDPLRPEQGLGRPVLLEIVSRPGITPG